MTEVLDWNSCLKSLVERPSMSSLVFVTLNVVTSIILGTDKKIKSDARMHYCIPWVRFLFHVTDDGRPL